MIFNNCFKYEDDKYFRYKIEKEKKTIIGLTHEGSECTELSIQEGVTDIGCTAFEIALICKKINISSSVKQIAHSAFSNCKKLEEITVKPDNPKYYSIKGVLFSKDKNIKTLVSYPISKNSTGCYSIPPETEIIGVDAFWGTNFVRIDVVDNVIEIDNYKFKNNKELSTIILFNSVKAIGEGAFYGCEKLKEVTIPDYVTKIEKGVFFGCLGLVSVKLSNKLKSIESEAFSGCKMLSEISIPDSVEYIGEESFSGCNELKDIVIPNSVTSVGKCAFMGCTKLTHISIPKNVEKLDVSCFCDCSGMQKISVDENNIYFSSQDDVLFNKDKTDLLYCPPRNIKINNYIIPDNVVLIGKHAFEYCTCLKSVTIPDSVTTIGDYAFQGCKGIESVTIPENVTEIGEGTFKCCTELNTVNYNAISCKINGSPFSLCNNIIELVIGEKVKNIPAHAFEDRITLNNIKIKNNNPPSIGYKAFDNTALKTIYVPKSAVDAYKSADGWLQYADIIVGYEE